MITRSHPLQFVLVSMCISAALVLCCSMAECQEPKFPGIKVIFAKIKKGRKILTSEDDFVTRLSPFDRAARMKTESEVSTRTYLEFVGKNVMAWNDDERKNVTAAFQGIHKKLEALALPLPKKVFLIKTTGKEEGGAAYTRGSAIVFPGSFLSMPSTMMQKALCHELFHILSRTNPDLKERLYAAIGFKKCNEVPFPEELRSRKLTNPDAPKNDHCIRLSIEGVDRWAIPILFSRTEKYDTERGGEFFNYLQFRFLVVERDAKTSTVKPIYEDKGAKLVEMRQVSQFYEQVGKNTGYIIHPEEILADNFALLVLQKENVPSPEIIAKLGEQLKQKNKTER